MGRSRTKPQTRSSRSKKAAFVTPTMAGTTRPSGRSRSASSARRPAPGKEKDKSKDKGKDEERWCTMVPSSQPGFPAAEQMDMFLHQTISKGGSSAGKGRGFRRVRDGKPRQADCYVEICPSGARDVVMHPGF